MKNTMKKAFALMMAMVMLVSMAACGGGSSENISDGGVTVKVGIVQYVDHASLNQIVENIEKRLDERGAELDITFEYEPYF